MSERLRLFQRENAFNSSEIATLNRILARDSQYAATCSLGAEEEVLVVKALISDPVSAEFSRSGADGVQTGVMIISLAVMKTFYAN